MRRNHPGHSPVFVLLLAAVVAPAFGQPTETIERALEVESGIHVSVMNFAGQVTVRAAPASERLLRFVAVKRLKPGVPGEEAEIHFRSVNLDLHQTERQVRIGPQTPRDADGQPLRIPLTDVRPPQRIPPVLVDLDLWLPEDVSLTVKSFTASISMDGIVAPRGRFLLRSISGPLHVDGLIAEDVVAETVSGDLMLRNLVAHRSTIETLTANILLGGRMQDDGWYEIRTHSGAVDLELDALAGFLLDASSFRGEIHSGLEPGAERTERSISARRGEGGPEMTVSTFSGPIRILAAPDR